MFSKRFTETQILENIKYVTFGKVFCILEAYKDSDSFRKSGPIYVIKVGWELFYIPVEKHFIIGYTISLKVRLSLTLIGLGWAMIYFIKLPIVIVHNAINLRALYPVI